MRRLLSALLFVSVCLFIASGLLYALAPKAVVLETVGQIAPPFVTPNSIETQTQPFGNSAVMPTPAPPGVPPPEFFLHSKGPIFWGLQILVWFASFVYLLRILGILRRDVPEIPAAPPSDEALLDWFVADDPRERSPAPLRDRTLTEGLLIPPPPDINAALDGDNTPPEPVPAPPAPILEILGVTIGLLTAAIFPWIFETQPVNGFLLATLMLSAMLAAALTRGCLGQNHRSSTSLGILAGWAMLATCAAFASLLERSLGTSDTLAALVSLLILAVAAANIQLHLGSPFGFSVTVIWGMLGLIVATIGTDASVATAAALSITFVGVALVRVST